MSGPSGAPSVVLPDLGLSEGLREVVLLPGRVSAFCRVELQKIRHDPWELATRLIQPALWLLLYGETFSSLHLIDTGNVPYLEYLAPGIIAQSAVFVAIFYGVQLVWERDAGILAKILVTPTPRVAVIAGKAFAAGLRGLVQAIVILLLATALVPGLRWSPLGILGCFLFVCMGAAFFSCLSMIIAGLAQRRERMMGIGQAISLPLFFASNALYPIQEMPPWLQIISRFNPLTYEVDALRGLLVGTPSNLPLDLAVMVGVVTGGILLAAAMVTRLVR